MAETQLLIHRISHEQPLLANHLMPFEQLNGMNHLVSSSLTLLLLLIQIKQKPKLIIEQIDKLKLEIVEEMHVFTDRAQVLQCPSKLILTARYCLCTALDEAVLSSDWGQHSDWSHHTLLSILHQETWGGERFFHILEEMARTPRENLSLLELLYLLLSLGFEGRYYHQLDIRDEVRHRLYHLIQQQKEEPEKALSPQLKKMVTKQARLENFSGWKTAKITGGLLLVLAIAFNVATYFSAKTVLHEMDELKQQIKMHVLTM